MRAEECRDEKKKINKIKSLKSSPTKYTYTDLPWRQKAVRL